MICWATTSLIQCTDLCRTLWTKKTLETIQRKYFLTSLKTILQWFIILKASLISQRYEKNFNYRQLTFLAYQNYCNAFWNIQQYLISVNQKHTAQISLECGCPLRGYLAQHMENLTLTKKNIFLLSKCKPIR